MNLMKGISDSTQINENPIVFYDYFNKMLINENANNAAIVPLMTIIMIVLLNNNGINNDESTQCSSSSSIHSNGICDNVRWANGRAWVGL